MINVRAEGGFLNNVGVCFHHATDCLSPNLETYQCAEWGNKQKEVADRTMVDRDEVLADKEYLVGGKFSIVDIEAFAGLAFAAFAKVEIPKTLSNLGAWRAKGASRPGIAGQSRFHSRRKDKPHGTERRF